MSVIISIQKKKALLFDSTSHIQVFQYIIAQSTGAVKYTDCFSTEE